MKITVTLPNLSSHSNVAIKGGLTGYFKGGKIKKVLDEFKAFSGWEAKEQKTENFCADNVTEAGVMKLSMAAANAGQIDHAQPGPIDGSVLTQQPNHRSKVIWNGQDPGSLTCRSRNEEFSNREPMVDDRVIDIIKALGLEGLLRISGREIDHGLITALVEILIKRLLEQVADPLLPNAEEDQVHKYARCYILALLGDTIFVDKSSDRVHLMWVQQLEDLRNPRRYSWGSACLAWLYRELWRASDKKASQIGGCLLLVQYWAWARFPYLCLTVEHGSPVGAYGPPVRGPLSLKWLWVSNKKNRPTHIFLRRYRKQIASMLPGQVVWQPYEVELEDLPPWCVARRAKEGRVDGNDSAFLHQIDLRGKAGVNWMRRHAMQIMEWGNRLQQRCEAVLGDMPLG
ncbi:hypothetical protein SO802_003182 [Lithocarpus litseifolius]|uniref:Aminotransferase-like plant mobile domain-containing protein n=1 Tax=Lithocarpus litseifolius TaxID=425828 RepID=A0AAW2DZN0_9ROSI